MNRTIVNQALFRICSPIFIGFAAYILLLLFNNQLEQLTSEFLNIELIIFITIAVMIQESTRLVIKRYTQTVTDRFALKQFILPLGLSIAIAILITTLVIMMYFKMRLGYTPEYYELLHFNIIFSLFALVYYALYMSFFLLEKNYAHSMKTELFKKQEIEADFIQYKNGINPDLLFECFESLIVLMHQDVDQADDLLSNVSQVYRYILSPKYQEIISLKEEYQYAHQLIKLFAALPYRKVDIANHINQEVFIVKGTLLTILESIMRSIIISETQKTIISLTLDAQNLSVMYVAAPKLNNQVMIDKINRLNESYRVYTDQEIAIQVDQHQHEILIPLLQLHNQDL